LSLDSSIKDKDHPPVPPDRKSKCRERRSAGAAERRKRMIRHPLQRNVLDIGWEPAANSRQTSVRRADL